MTTSRRSLALPALSIAPIPPADANFFEPALQSRSISRDADAGTQNLEIAPERFLGETASCLSQRSEGTLSCAAARTSGRTKKNGAMRCYWYVTSRTCELDTAPFGACSCAYAESLRLRCSHRHGRDAPAVRLLRHSGMHRWHSGQLSSQVARSHSAWSLIPFSADPT